MNFKFALLLLIVVIGHTMAYPDPGVEVHKSQPVKINGLEFVAATQAKWPLPSGNAQSEVAVQLLITNRTKADLYFRTFDTFNLSLKNSAGVLVPASGMRSYTKFTSPELIAPGTTCCIGRDAYLTKAPSQPVGFRYWDGTGSVSNFGGFMPSTALAPGSYSLSFNFHSTEENLPAPEPKFYGKPMWSGEGTTKEAFFRIVDRL